MASDSDLEVESATNPSPSLDDVLKDRRSIYQKFCLLSSDEVANKWKTAESLVSSKETMISLSQHADLVFEQISSEFFVWVEKVEMENLRINIETLKELFQVGLANPSVLSLHLAVKEMPFVTKSVAKSMKNYQKYERALFHRQLLWDAAYENFKSKKNKKTNWFIESSNNEALTGSTLWNEVLLVDVRKGICSWLLKCPKYKRPASLEPYLKSCDVSGELGPCGTRKQSKFWIFDEGQYRKENEEFKKSLPVFREIGSFWEDA